MNSVSNFCQGPYVAQEAHRWECKGSGDTVVVHTEEDQLWIQSVRISAQTERIQSAKIDVPPSADILVLPETLTRSKSVQNLRTCSLSTETKMSYSSALQYCKSTQRTLPMVNNQQDNNLLLDQLQHLDNIWLGYTKTAGLWKMDGVEAISAFWDNVHVSNTGNCVVLDKTKGLWKKQDCNFPTYVVCCDYLKVASPKGSVPRVEMNFRGFSDYETCNVLDPNLITEPLNYFSSPSNVQRGVCNKHANILNARSVKMDPGYHYLRCTNVKPQNLQMLGIVTTFLDCALRCRKNEIFVVSKVDNELWCFCKPPVTENDNQSFEAASTCVGRMTPEECQRVIQRVLGFEF